MTDDLKYRIKDNESEEDYELRICSYHDSDELTWFDIADIINKELGKTHTESRYRRQWYAYVRGREDQVKSEEISPEVSELIQAKIELQKEKVKLTDERVQTNAYIRQLAREETLKEIAEKVANEMSSKKMLPYVADPKNKNCKNEAILEISDWHYGLECDNFWNKYNPEIAKERIAILLDKTIKHCSENDVKILHVVNLADLIAGRIHYQLRIQSRFDVITQIIQVSEILAEFLNTLANFFEVHYYDCLDNHSRLEPNKKESLDLESLARITPWYLKTRVGTRINIHSNEFGEDIITFKSMRYEVLGVHGDKDKPNTVVDNLSMMTHKHYDLVLTAHLHHFSADEKNETVVISNGSLMGTDDYAKNLRLSSKPSQNLIIVTENCPCECIYRITLG